MTTIILTIIGILLAAAAALMVIFYGGDAFNAGSVGAKANTLQNAGTNVISALQLAKADGVNVNDAAVTLPSLTGASTTDDLSDDYLKEFPTMESVGSAAPALANGVLTVAEVPGDVCARVNKNLGNIAPTTETQNSFKMGCVPGASATADGTFFARG